MILKVFANACHFHNRIDTSLAKHLSPPDAGKLENMRRTDGAGRKDGFPSRPHGLQHAVVVKLYAFDRAFFDDRGGMDNSCLVYHGSNLRRERRGMKTLGADYNDSARVRA